jgi:hypothetical protein
VLRAKRDRERKTDRERERKRERERERERERKRNNTGFLSLHTYGEFLLEFVRETSFVKEPP